MWRCATSKWVVTVAGPGWKEPPSKLFVVLGRKSGGVKLTELGGTQNGRYWPNVPFGYISGVVSLDELADALRK